MKATDDSAISKLSYNSFFGKKNIISWKYRSVDNRSEHTPRFVINMWQTETDITSNSQCKRSDAMHTTRKLIKSDRYTYTRSMEIYHDECRTWLTTTLQKKQDCQYAGILLSSIQKYMHRSYINLMLLHIIQSFVVHGHAKQVYEIRKRDKTQENSNTIHWQ